MLRITTSTPTGPGDQLRVNVTGATNSTVGPHSFQISTTSDTNAVTSPTYTLVAAQAVSNTSVVPSATGPGATGVAYTANFTTSSTGQLVFPGTVTLTGPAGTFTNASFSIFDVTEQRTVGGSIVSNNGATVVLRITTSTPTGPGDQLQVNVTNATNSTAGTHSIDIETTSDTSRVTTPYTLGSGTPPPPDTTPPNATITGGPTGTTTVSSPTFEFNSNEAGSTFQCSVDGGPFVDCSSPFTVPSLPAGPHTFAVRARDAAGNVGPATTVSFTVAAQTIEDLPDPTIGEEVNIGPVGDGPVLIGTPAATATAGAHASQKGVTFVPLTEARQVPVGSFLDTRKGTVALQSARDRLGTRQTGTFLNGLFQVRQSRKLSAKGRTDLNLKGGSFSRCRSVGKGKPTAALSRRQIRRLRANARGRFRTGGRNSSATVRGTIWDIADRCDGTLTKVRRGSVVVRDFRRKRNIVVRAGKSYLARAPG